MKNKKGLQKIILFLSFFLLCLNCFSIQTQAAKVKMNKKQATMWVGEQLQLKITGGAKKVSWSSSKKKVATVSKNGTVFAKSVGQTTITAKCNGKEYKCNVTVTSGETEVMQENGVYTSKEKVALYIHTYKKLPSNFITKEQANALGWNGGSLLSYAPDKCIGGNKYTNYEKTLPAEDGRVYYECDINTLGALERGAERLVYSNDGLIYYTADHYATFQQLY